MLDILTDGPFRYIHCAATGELVLTLEKVGRCFIDYDADTIIKRTLRHWKAVARQRIGDRLITDTDR